MKTELHGTIILKEGEGNGQKNITTYRK